MILAILHLAVWLAWDAPTTGQLPVQGYRIYYGPTSGQQTIFKDVGNVTAGEVTNMPVGVPVYFVCRSYNTMGESAPSNEVVYTQPAPTPTPTPAPTPVPVRYQLTVRSGDGGGLYPAGARVTVTAAPPPPGGAFSTWLGGVQFLDDMLSPTTILTMPPRNIILTAIYRRQ